MDSRFKEILEKVRPEIFDDEDCDLVEDGIIDSLDIMTIISHCEEAFNVDFDPLDILPENFASPESIWNLILKYQAEEK